MKNWVFYAVLLLSMYSCKNNSETSNQESSPVNAVVSHEEHAQGANPVTLNNGQKWEANPETTTGMENMSSLVNGFTGQDDPMAYHALETSLEAEFNQILQKCTMTGEAHEQLHRYLIPMTEMFKKLNSEDLQVCKNGLEEIKLHVSEYNNFFQ